MTGLVAVALLAVAAPAMAADTKSKISVAEKRLKWLAGQVASKRAQVAAIQGSMRLLAQEIRQGNDALYDLERSHKSHENMLIDTMARYDSLRQQMGAASAEAYMRGPISYFGVVLGAQTIADADDAAMFTGLVLGRNQDLAGRTAHEATKIADLKARDAAAIKQRATLLRDLRRRQDAMLRQFESSQQALEDIAAIQDEVQGLLVTLRRTLRAEEEAAFGGTMPYGRWAEAFLTFIGARRERGNLVAMVAWQLAEGTSARWNPLATTWKMPGSTSFNGHRVQNYVSLQQGLEATRKTLSRPGHRYEAILSSLASSAEAMTTARAINASNWCRGCAGGEYVIELIPTVERYYDRYAGRRG